MNQESVVQEEYLSSLLSSTLPRIEQVELLLFRLPLKSPFETSFGSIDHREIILCRLNAEGLSAWGECAADEDPLYSSEANFTAWPVLQKYLLPALRSGNTIGSFLRAAVAIRGHQMAKATLEAALWDLLAKSKGIPLFRLWGATVNKIPCGVSIGLQKNRESLLATLRGYLNEGYRRIKVKIKPGRDLDLVRSIRSEFPDIPLMADANAAYTLADLPLLRSLDEHRLMMIEQPLHFDDIYEHSHLQAQLQTPVCLDESIHSVMHARTALELKSCRIINIKTSRVGGHTESIRIHNVCMQQNIPVWCGGMLESGIGRAHNLALAALPNFKLPGDTSASNRYWHQDIVNPAVTIDREGFAHLPEKPGFGFDVDEDYLNSLVQERFRFSV